MENYQDIQKIQSIIREARLKGEPHRPLGDLAIETVRELKKYMEYLKPNLEEIRADLEEFWWESSDSHTNYADAGGALNVINDLMEIINRKLPEKF